MTNARKPTREEYAAQLAAAHARCAETTAAALATMTVEAGLRMVEAGDALRALIEADPYGYRETIAPMVSDDERARQRAADRLIPTPRRAQRWRAVSPR
jgi:hypothetical protein